MKIQFGGKIDLMKVIQEIINDRDRKLILNGDLIKGGKEGNILQSTYFFKTMKTREE